MNDTAPPIPLLVDALLDGPTLEQLFRDLAEHAEVQEVREKAGPRDHSPQATLTLETARDRTLSGAARAIQVRYHYDGFDWTDTLIRQPGGIKVVRCRHEV